MKRTSFLCVLLFLVVFLFITSCDQQGLPKQGILSITIENSIAKDIKVTEVPMDTKNYSIEIIDSNGKVVKSKTILNVSEKIEYSTVLDLGTYKVKATALNENSAVIGEGSEDITVAANTENKCAITVKETVGKGTLNYTINSKEDLTIKILANEAVVDTAHIKASEKATTNNFKLDNGTYTIQITPENGSAAVSKAVKIVAGQATTFTYDYTLPTPEISLKLNKDKYNTDDTELIVTASIIGIVADKYNYEWYIGSDKVTPKKTETGYIFDISDFTEADYELKLIIRRNDLYKFEESIAFEVVPATTAKDLLNGKSVFSTVTATLNEETTNLLIGLSFNGESISAKGSNTTISSFSGSATKETYTTIFTATETVGADTISMDFELSFTPNLNDNTVLITGEAKTNEGTEMVATLNGTVPLIDDNPDWLFNYDWYYYEAENKKLSFLRLGEWNNGEYDLGDMLDTRLELGLTVKDNVVTVKKDMVTSETTEERITTSSVETITKETDSYSYLIDATITTLNKSTDNSSTETIKKNANLTKIEKLPEWAANYDYLNENNYDLSVAISNAEIEKTYSIETKPLIRVERINVDADTCKITLFAYDEETKESTKIVTEFSRIDGSELFEGTYTWIELNASGKEIFSNGLSNLEFTPGTYNSMEE